MHHGDCETVRLCKHSPANHTSHTSVYPYPVLHRGCSLVTCCARADCRGCCIMLLVCWAPASFKPDVLT